MTKYAVLGSTRSSGTALIQNLLQSTQQNTVHAYCPDESKLRRLVIEVVDNKKVRIFAGSIYDVDLMKECIGDTRAIFLVVTTNDNVPGCRLSLHSATTVVQALQELRASGQQMLPRLVLLSSCMIDDHLSRDMPRWARYFLLASASHVYEDLRRTEAMFRSHSSWLSVIFINPARLSPGVVRGHRLTLDEQESFVSYLDLAAGMVEAADDEEDGYDGRNVSVVNITRGLGAKFAHGTPWCILTGLVRHFLPWLHPFLPTTGPA